MRGPSRSSRPAAPRRRKAVVVPVAAAPKTPAGPSIEPPTERIQVVHPRPPAPVEPTPMPATESPRWHIGRSGLFGLGLAAAGVTVLVLLSTLAILHSDAFRDPRTGTTLAPEHTAFLGEFLTPTTPSYSKTLAAAPLWAGGTVVVAGLALAAVDLLRPAAPRVRLAHEVSAAGLALAGFVFLLAGTRYLALWTLRATGPSSIAWQLREVPFLDLGVGAALVAAAAWILRGALRDLPVPRHATEAHPAWPALSLAVGALALLGVPFVAMASMSFGTSETTTSVRYGEASMDTLRYGSGLAGTGRAWALYAVAHAALWASFALGLVGLVAASVARRRGSPLARLLTHAPVLGALPALAGVVTAALLPSALRAVHVAPGPGATAIAFSFTPTGNPTLLIVLGLLALASAASAWFGFRPRDPTTTPPTALPQSASGFVGVSTRSGSLDQSTPGTST